MTLWGGAMKEEGMLSWVLKSPRKRQPITILVPVAMTIGLMILLGSFYQNVYAPQQDDAVSASDAELLLFSSEPLVLPPETPYRSIFFTKFKKVGGTTVSLVLGTITNRLGWTNACTKTGEEISCLQHRSMRIMQDSAMGATPMQRINAQVARPLTVTVFRHPVEKLISALFFYAVQSGDEVTDGKMLKELTRNWVYQREYKPVLGARGEDEEPDMALAKQTLAMYDVIGITDNIPLLFVQVARKLGISYQNFVFKSAKVIQGRPTLEQLPQEVQEKIRLIMKEDNNAEIELYELAKEIADKRADAEPGSRDDAQRLLQLSEQLSSGCDETEHGHVGANGGQGQWCWQWGGSAEDDASDDGIDEVEINVSAPERR